MSRITPLCGPSLLNDNPYETPNAAGSSAATVAPHVSRWSLALSVALLNFAAWQVGVFFNFFGGAIDSLGATLCIATWFLAPIVIVGATIYSPIRRFVLPVRTWDFYGPAVAILAYVIMHRQMHVGTRY